MRAVGKLLGWITTILVLALVVAFGVAAEVASDMLEMPDLVAWGIIAGFVVLFFAVFGPGIVRSMRPQERQARRTAREREREKRRKLENFELE